MRVEKRAAVGCIPYLYFIAETDQEADLLAEVLGSTPTFGEYCGGGLEVVGQPLHCHNCHGSFVRLAGTEWLRKRVAEKAKTPHE